MSQDASVTTNTTVASSQFTLPSAVIAAVIKENFRKQQEDINALAESAYVLRRGRRELQDPKRLALAIQLRGKCVADFATFTRIIGEGEQISAYVKELAAGIANLIEAESPELRQRLSRFLLDLNNRYSSLNQAGQPEQATQSR